MVSGEWGVGSGEWGVGSGECGVGSGEWSRVREEVCNTIIKRMPYPRQ